MKDKLRRFIAMVMCAVLCAGMAPETLLGAFAEEVREEAGNTGITIQYTYPEDAIDTSAEAPIVFEADEDVNYFYFDPSSDINSEFVYLMRVPGKKRDKQYFKTYTFKGDAKIRKSFKVVLTDKAGAKATVSALEKQNFEGSRSNVTIKN